MRHQLVIILLTFIFAITILACDQVNIPDELNLLNLAKKRKRESSYKEYETNYLQNCLFSVNRKKANNYDEYTQNYLQSLEKNVSGLYFSRSGEFKLLNELPDESLKLIFSFLEILENERKIKILSKNFHLKYNVFLKQDKQNLMSMIKCRLDFEKMNYKEGYFYAFFEKVDCSSNIRDAFFFIKTDIFSENLSILRKDFKRMCTLETGEGFLNDNISQAYAPEPCILPGLRNPFGQTHPFPRGEIQSPWNAYTPEPGIPSGMRNPFVREIQSPWRKPKFIHKIVLLDNGKVYILKILQDGNVLIMKPKNFNFIFNEQPPELIPSFLQDSVEAMTFCRESTTCLDPSKYNIPYGILLYSENHPYEECVTFDPFESTTGHASNFYILYSKYSAGFLKLHYCGRVEYSQYEIQYGMSFRQKIRIAVCTDQKKNLFKNVKHYELSENQILEKMKLEGIDFQEMNVRYA